MSNRTYGSFCRACTADARVDRRGAPPHRGSCSDVCHSAPAIAGRMEVIVSMSRVKFVPLSLIAVVLATAAISDSASALNYLELGGGVVPANERMSGGMGRTAFNLEINGTKVLIECYRTLLVDETETNGATSGSFEFSPSACFLSEIRAGRKTVNYICEARIYNNAAETKVLFKDQLVASGGGVTIELTTNVMPYLFIVKIEGVAGCGLRGTTTNVEGSVKGEIENSGRPETGHTQTFTSTGSSLRTPAPARIGVSFTTTVRNLSFNPNPREWYAG
jgi:hypothetical protein